MSSKHTQASKTVKIKCWISCFEESVLRNAALHILIIYIIFHIQRSFIMFSHNENIMNVWATNTEFNEKVEKKT